MGDIEREEESQKGVREGWGEMERGWRGLGVRQGEDEWWILKRLEMGWEEEWWSLKEGGRGEWGEGGRGFRKGGEGGGSG